MRPDPSFWRGRRVLVTGHTGFKGSWLTLWLHRLGASVTGIALPPPTTPSLHMEARLSNLCDSVIQDVRDSQGVAVAIEKADPEIVFHLAAQPLVRRSYIDPIETWSTNVMGTAHVLEAARAAPSLRALIAITTDKVYRNPESSVPFRESDELGGHDPYSASKAACELLVSSHRDSYFAERGIALASARAGNVIGGGDWAADRLLPDLVRAWQGDVELSIRNPESVRPWQHVLEPLLGYLVLAERCAVDRSFAEAFNFGPAAGSLASVDVVLRRAAVVLPIEWTNKPQGGQPHEAGTLVLDSSKAEERLGVASALTVDEAVEWTCRWYAEHRSGSDPRALCERDIENYERILGGRHVAENGVA